MGKKYVNWVIHSVDPSRMSKGCWSVTRITDDNIYYLDGGVERYFKRRVIEGHAMFFNNVDAEEYLVNAVKRNSVCIVKNRNGRWVFVMEKQKKDNVKILHIQHSALEYERRIDELVEAGWKISSTYYDGTTYTAILIPREG